MMDEDIHRRLDQLEARVSKLEAAARLREPIGPAQFNVPIGPGSVVQATRAQVAGLMGEHVDRALVQEAFTEYVVEILATLEQLHWFAKCNCHMGRSTKTPPEPHHAECPVGKAQKLLDEVWRKRPT